MDKETPSQTKSPAVNEASSKNIKQPHLIKPLQFPQVPLFWAAYQFDLATVNRTIF
jgi:hypothetical protein